MAPSQPPSQAGRFKPRKPRRRTAETPIAIPSSAPSAAAPGSGGIASAPAASRGGRRNIRGSGGGRGGRGRRGRGTPIPMGRAFFTGTTRGTKTSSSSAAPIQSPSNPSVDTASAKKSRQTGKDKTGGDEIVVGKLDRSVGAATNEKNKAAASSILDSPIAGEDTKFPTEEKASVKPATMLYDSDSSDDGIFQQNRGRASPRLMQPLALPVRKTDTTSYAMDEVRSSTTVSAALPLDGNENDWFLVQLPTRLPDMPLHNEHTDGDGDNDASQPQIPMVVDDKDDDDETKPVATPAIDASCFDNTLLLLKKGAHVGKMRVYKSGKTVLHWGDSVDLAVREGMTCNFAQQVVMMNERDYVHLGNVGKTLIVTPDIATALNEEVAST